MATKSKKPAKSLGNLNLATNIELINNIKLHPSLWYRERYTKKDEAHWSSISVEMGVQKSWLKKRWHQLRTECNSSTLHNPALAWHLKFLKKIPEDVENADDERKDNDEGDEFHVTQEQLDESMDETDSNDFPTINCDADNESTDSFEEYEFTIVDDADDADADSNQLPSPEKKDEEKTENITIEKVVEDRCSTLVPKLATSTRTDSMPLKESPGSEAPEMEYQDKVFGDLVAAMLQQMTPERKKQVKKDIMNILL